MVSKQDLEEELYTDPEPEEQAEGDDEVDGEYDEDPALIVPLVEALLFAVGEPMDVRRIRQATKLPKEEIEAAISDLTERYQDDQFGFELVQVAGKYQFRTKAFAAPYVQAFKTGKPRRLSPPALETLAIVAYRQPIVKSDVEKIRGVDATPTIKTLLDRKLIKIVGHKATAGQPALFGTTEEFLKLFGLSSLAELPTLRDLRELESDPGENDEEFTGEDIEEIEGDEAPEETLEPASDEISNQDEQATESVVHS